MPLDTKRVVDLAEGDILELISNGIEEGREIDYKELLKIGSDGDKKEFLADVSSFANASGTLSKITDYKPTANYSGGTSVPVFYDALGVAWSPTWDLGAVHH